MHIEHYQRELVTTSDARGYYAYLPATFIYGDALFHDFETLPPSVRGRYWVRKTERGAYIPKVTMGVSIAMLPGFLVGHAGAHILGYETDGWSAPYQLAIALNAVWIMLLGFWMLYHWLSRRFPPWQSALTILLLFFATNLLYYGIDLNAMSHVYTFTLLSAMLLLLDRWVNDRHPAQFLLLGLLAGWITLIRPINGLFLLIPAGVALNAILQSKARWGDFLGRKLLLSMLGFGIMLIPQLLFWKAATGHWVHYSYGSETFYFGSPHVLDGCFSYRNGWLLYTPIMLLVPFGMAALWKNHRHWTLLMLALLPVYLYVVFSWWCWYYGDSFSIRAMIDIYPLLALALVAVIHWIGKGAWWLRAAGGLLGAFFLVNNIWMVQQYHRGLITGSTMTKEAFWAVWWNPNAPGHLDLIGAYQIGDNDRLRMGMPEREHRDTIVEREVGRLTFDHMDRGHRADGWQGFGQRVNEGNPYSPALKVLASDFETPFDRTLNISCYVWSEDFEQSGTSLVISFMNGDDTYLYRTVDFADMNLEPNAWHRIDAYVREPQDLPQTGHLATYAWFHGKGEVIVDHFEVRQLDCPYRENE